jgi:Ni/Fe-hydrogenase 1 B-type cytochrome subunit
MAHGGHYREAHPLIFVFTHWINLVCMALLAFTGFYIHSPFLSGIFAMSLMRGTHFLAMWILIVNLTARIVLAFFVKDTLLLGVRGPVELDIKNWLPQKENQHQFFETIKYYLFFRKEGVISGKYGNLQKIAYLATIPITFGMAYTGFALYPPFQNLAFFKAGADAVGGLMSMRVVHYFGMWVIILFTAIHAYLANIYNFAPSKLIFMWKETPDPHEAKAAVKKAG